MRVTSCSKFYCNPSMNIRPKLQGKLTVLHIFVRYMHMTHLPWVGYLSSRAVLLSQDHNLKDVNLSISILGCKIKLKLCSIQATIIRFTKHSTDNVTTIIWNIIESNLKPFLPPNLVNSPQVLSFAKIVDVDVDPRQTFPAIICGILVLFFSPLGFPAFLALFSFRGYFLSRSPAVFPKGWTYVSWV